jgi:hypothetical protein
MPFSRCCIRFTSSPLSPRTSVLVSGTAGFRVVDVADVVVVVDDVVESSRPAKATDTTVRRTASAK